MYYYNISSTQTDPLSTEYLWSSSGTQTLHKAIAPHWSSSYPDYLSLDQDEGEQRRIVWSRLHNHQANLANRLTRTRDRYLEARRALNPRTTQAESSHNPLYRDTPHVKGAAVWHDFQDDSGYFVYDVLSQTHLPIEYDEDTKQWYFIRQDSRSRKWNAVNPVPQSYNLGRQSCHETTAHGVTRLESVVLGVELCIAR